MKVDVLLGLQWGDEGKGKVVDVLTPGYKNIVRFQGGPNAGHTLEFNKIKHVLHSIPSGIFHTDKVNIIGNGMVIDPILLKSEIKELEALGVNVKTQLLISDKVNLILPTHRLLDAAYEAKKGKNKIGSTLKGIGPVYTDKVARCGLRAGDLLSDSYEEKYENIIAHHTILLEAYKGEKYSDEDEAEWNDAIDYLRKLNIINTEYYINQALDKNQTVLAEGAQGTMLDIDYGSYPFVTSSNTVCAAVSNGMGIAPAKMGEVYGIFKAYCTRVGGGPFPTELNDEDGQKLRDEGNEYGATTGRPRRCGWLDMVALKYSIMLNGVTQLIMTKVDVLNHFNEINVATAYRSKNGETNEIPYDLETIDPVYKSIKGWNQPLDNVNTKEALPQALKDYIQWIEDETGVPVTMISVGPDRKQIIMMR
ncbi:MAG: adenylosuccinate synthase [Candidatus Delongbacteria bacterium]|jgi:adenylosuccinate synthase|nr:adenylosuccinate synthase [Candidatus Delongbacteria bacterium]